MPPVIRTRLDHVCGRHLLTVVLTAAQALRRLIDHVAIAHQSCARADAAIAIAIATMTRSINRIRSNFFSSYC